MTAATSAASRQCASPRRITSRKLRSVAPQGSRLYFIPVSRRCTRTGVRCASTTRHSFAVNSSLPGTRLIVYTNNKTSGRRQKRRSYLPKGFSLFRVSAAPASLEMCPRVGVRDGGVEPILLSWMGALRTLRARGSRGALTPTRAEQSYRTSRADFGEYTRFNFSLEAAHSRGARGAIGGGTSEFTD